MTNEAGILSKGQKTDDSRKRDRRSHLGKVWNSEKVQAADSNWGTLFLEGRNTF